MFDTFVLFGTIMDYQILFLMLNLKAFIPQTINSAQKRHSPDIEDPYFSMLMVRNLW